VRSLSVFNSISLDGYFVDANGDMSWAHRNDPEWNEFVAGNASGESVIVFGRVTYQMMAGWWPTPAALQSMPAVAERMNSLQKVVFSRTLDRVEWNNTTLVKEDPASAIRRLKQETGPDMVVLGSGTIIAQLADAGLIDGCQIALTPVVLGGGRSMFEGVRNRPRLKLRSSRAFANGNVFLWYERAA